MTNEQQKQLEQIQAKAKVRHEENRKKATRQGRDFPLLPYECSWAFEEYYRKSLLEGAKHANDH